MLLIQSEKSDYKTKINGTEKKITDHDHDKYITTPELNKKLKQLILQKNGVNLFIVYELDTWSQDINGDFPLINCLFGSVKLTKNSDPENI